MSSYSIDDFDISGVYQSYYKSSNRICTEWKEFRSEYELPSVGDNVGIFTNYWGSNFIVGIGKVLFTWKKKKTVYYKILLADVEQNIPSNSSYDMFKKYSVIKLESHEVCHFKAFQDARQNPSDFKNDDDYDKYFTDRRFEKLYMWKLKYAIFMKD